MLFDNLSLCTLKGGRITEYEGIQWLGWSGSYLEFETEAPEITVTFHTDENEAFRINPGRTGIWVNGLRKYNPERKAQEAVLSGNVLLTSPVQKETFPIGKAGERKTVKIAKLSECSLGMAGVSVIETPGNYEIRPTLPKKHLLEVIGDSITCGYGNEGRDGIDLFSSATENALDAYGVLTAEKLDMDWRLVSWSGIGVLADYTPPEMDRPNRGILMQDLYPYHDARTEEKLLGEFKGAGPFYTDHRTLFSFSERKPDAIVIFLGTNDLSYTRGIQERNEDFAYEYRRFLDEVHKLNPGSPILCTLGLQGMILNDTAKDVVESYAERHPEADIRFLGVNEQPALGRGIDGHPCKETHAYFSDMVAGKLREMIG